MPSSQSTGPARCIAVDWSGSASAPGQRQHIVAADCHAGVVNLSSGRTRAETIAWLIGQSLATPHLAVGLDFAFSYPAWFVQEQRATTADTFWRIVAERGEDWLASCRNPFWGRPGVRCPAGHRAPGWSGYRAADRPGEPGIQPKSPFQIGGAGAVGTGSLRGIPSLLTLRDAGFSIWPFHPPSFPMAMEIYPRSFTGPVNKSDKAARKAYLVALHADLPRDAVQSAIESDDAFDALCSVLGMARQAETIARLQQAADMTTLLEGTIFPGAPLEPTELSSGATPELCSNKQIGHPGRSSVQHKG